MGGTRSGRNKAEGPLPGPLLVREAQAMAVTALRDGTRHLEALERIQRCLELPGTDAALANQVVAQPRLCQGARSTGRAARVQIARAAVMHRLQSLAGSGWPCLAPFDHYLAQ